jgi:hypothetical protein
VLAGLAEGRRSDRDITIFDSTGLAIQDLAIGWPRSNARMGWISSRSTFEQVSRTGFATLARVDEYAAPILPSKDLEETLAFYSRLGFELRGAPIEQYRYLIIGRGSIELHFWDAPMSIP